MQYSYIIQAISSRSNGYVSYSSNDYCLSDRVYRPSPCSCCVFPFTGVPSNPRFFNGFRQSSLIYLPAYRRLVLGGGDRFSQVPVCDFGRSCGGESCSVRNCCQCSCTSRNGCGSWEGTCGGCKCGVDRGPVCCGRYYPIKESFGCGGVSRRRGTAGKSKCLGWEEKSERCDYGVECSPVCSGRCYPIKESRGYSGVDRNRRTEGKWKCLGWEEKSERCDSVTDEATEELLNLLSEKDDENFVGHKEKKVAERISKVKRRKGENKRRERYAEYDRLERDSRSVAKSVKKLSEEDYRSLGSKKNSRDESRELRKNVSNCSSYHSVMSSDESVESDVDVHVKHENFGGESSGTNKKESGRSFQEDVSVKKVIKQTEKNNDDADRYREVLRQRDAATQTTSLEVGSDLHVINEERKQLMDVSAQQGESRIESSNHKTGAETAFVSQKLRDDLVSKYSADDTREQHIQMGGQIFQHDSSRINSQRLMEMSQIQDDDSERASSSKTHFRGREENLVASVNLFKGERDGHSQTGQIIGQSESRRYLQPRYRVLGSHNTDIRNTSTPWMPFESTSKIEDQRSAPTFHREEELDFQTGQPVGQETKPAEESVGLSTIAEITNNDTVILNETNTFGIRMSSQEETSGPSVPGMRTCTSLRLPESSWKNRHVSSTLLPSSCHDIEDQKVVLEQSSTKDSQDETNISRTLVSNTEIFGDPNKHYERRMSPREEISVSRMNLVQDTKQTQQETGQRIEQLESRKEFDKPTEVSGFWRTSGNRASSSQQLNPSQEASGKQINEHQENERNSPVMVTPPPPQIIDVTPQYTVFHPESPSKPSGEIYSEMPGSGSTLVIQEIVQFPPSKGNIDEDQSTIPFYEDRLGSAIRSEESSSQFVRELVENLSHEVPTSEFPDKKVFPETTSSNKDELTQQSPNQATTEILRTQVDDSRKSSSRSGARGPSDEIWDVAGSFSEEPGTTEAPSEPGMTETPSEGNSTTKSTITKRSRSLWNIIGDIVRLRWSADSETHILKVKSGGKSSSNESVGSEAWFSSHEADEKGDENAKKGRKSTPKVHGSSDQHSLVNTEMLSLKGASEGTNLKNQILGIEADAVSSLDPQESNPASKSASSSSIVECTSQKLNESDTSLSSPLPSRHLIQSPAVKGEIPESGKGSVSRSDILQMEQPVRESQTVAIGTDMKDGELHRRKLQRKKQVEKEHFEEWEEAYRLESEQRKIDEVFMKEALLEAKKAADTWEVPVGAVLVQDGKIIARGCNLVEDLRDSTAHAEMICIREASKTLRTWRLAETTLYVTLEPCAMCAGAILQARIDTVVYGAPNKLLGADGSWVRLFPGENEEGSSSSTNQTAGPVHPFHPKITIRRGVLATECADVMQQFFRLRRKKKSSNSPPTSSSSISNHPSKFISKLHDIFHIMYCL